MTRRSDPISAPARGGRRRPHGSGSVETRKRDYHILRFDTGVEPTGERIRHSFVFRGTRKEAEVALRKAITERDSGMLITGESLTVADYLKRWLETDGKQQLKPSTFDLY